MREVAVGMVVVRSQHGDVLRVKQLPILTTVDHQSSLFNLNLSHLIATGSFVYLHILFFN